MTILADVRDVVQGDAGFQAQMGLAAGNGGRQPASPAAVAAAARLDTGETSPHVLEDSREDRRKRKRHYHAELVRSLRSMDTGEHGGVAQAVAEKWLSDVQSCPGAVRQHRVCGRLSFLGTRCSFPLCPWCQGRRSKRLMKKLAPLVAGMKERKLWTFSPPNLAELTGEAVGDIGKVLTELHRLAYFKRRCRGGIRSIEVTNKGNGWNLHGHELVDASWVAHYPQTDIAPNMGLRGRFLKQPWKVVRRHKGLAWEFTRICQEYSSLKSLRLDFDIDDPNHWYFVDLRVMEKDGVAEIAKYAAKGSQVVKAGPGAIVDYLLAMKSKRLVQTFGNLHGVSVADDDDGDDGRPGVTERQGECPYDDCPEPGRHEWLHVYTGFPDDGVQLEFNLVTGTSRVVVAGGIHAGSVGLVAA